MFAISKPGRLLPAGVSLTALIAVPALVAAAPAHRPAARSAPRYGATRPSALVEVNTGRGRLVTLAQPMSDLFVANPDIADVQVRSPTQLYVFGRKTGETTVSATNKAGQVLYAATVRVGTNQDSVQAMLSLAMPEARVVATPMNGLVLLTGTVAAPADAAEAERLTQAFVGPDTKVLSRLKTATPLQVMLQVRIAEVSRSFVKNIGVNLRTQPQTVGNPSFAGVSGSPGSITYNAGTGGKTSTFTEGAQRATLALAGHALGADFLSTLEAGETIGQVSTLNNQTLSALSGETASLLAGGQIPIPVSQGLGAVSIEYKNYGVSLAFSPTVLADGRISMRVRTEVSQLSSAGATQINGTTIPALTTNSVETSTELGSGESMPIGGLLSNSHDNNIAKTPALGDLPILGALFRSNGWKRNETELMIVITPYLVHPIVNQADVHLPTDGEQAPTDLQRVLLGKLGGGKSGASRPVPTMATPLAAAPSLGAVAPVPTQPAQVPAASAETRAPTRQKKGAADVSPGFSN